MPDNQELTSKELWKPIEEISQKLKTSVKLWVSDGVIVGKGYFSLDIYEWRVALPPHYIAYQPFDVRYYQDVPPPPSERSLNPKEEMQKQLTATQQALDIAVEALEFYAKAKNEPSGKIICDGSVARAALASIKK